MLLGQPVTSGVLLQIQNSTALVSTSKGTTSCPILTQTNLNIGDTVAIKNGNIISKLVPDDQIPTFEV
jgi:hypothetical protein